MKNILIIFSALFLLSACQKETERPKTTTPPKEETQSETPKETTPQAENTETTGEFNYYVSQAPEGFTKTAVNEVCFTPAQLDTTNNGEMFCFSNKERALDQLKIPTDDETCKEYSGVATVEIKDLTDENSGILKSDSCFTDGSCKFNEAELVKVKEITDEAKCRS